MSEKSVNKRIRKLLEQDFAEAVADMLRFEATGPATEAQSNALQSVAECKAQTLGRFEALMRRGPPPPTPAPGPAKWVMLDLFHEAEEAIARWLESEGWNFDEVSCQYWQHPKLGQTDGLWEAAQRQREG